MTALTGLAIMWASTGAWDQEETIAAVTLASAALLAYLLPNGGDGPGEPKAEAYVERETIGW